jgi:hypothetical protein
MGCDREINFCRVPQCPLLKATLTSDLAGLMSITVGHLHTQIIYCLLLVEYLHIICNIFRNQRPHLRISYISKLQPYIKKLTCT